MRSTHRAVSRGTHTARRKLVWATLDQSVTLAAAAHQNVNLLASLAVAGSSLLGVTIMRTHVHFTVTPGEITGGMIYGLIVGRALDVGAGVGPNPISDSELDWMWYDRFHPVAAGGGAVTDGHTVEIDCRAKRKMDELSQAYLLSFGNTNAAANQVIRMFGRTLVALP